MELKTDMDFVELYANRLKNDARLFAQQKILIESQMKASQSFFKNAFGKNFKKGARDYLKKMGLIKFKNKDQLIIPIKQRG